MDEKKNNALKTFLILSFIIFITIYISQATGYYEYTLSKRVELTNEQISKFEKDIKDGKEIDLEDYLENGVESYSNGFSKVGTNISKFTSKYVKKGIEATFNFIESLLS